MYEWNAERKQSFPPVSSVVCSSSTLGSSVFWSWRITSANAFASSTSIPNWNYTRNEWKRCVITLETSEKDAKLHSKRVEKIAFSGIFQRYSSTYVNGAFSWSLPAVLRTKTSLVSGGEDWENTLVPSGEDGSPSSRADSFFDFLTGSFFSGTLTSLKIHSFRVEKMLSYTRNEWKSCKNYTRNECVFTNPRSTFYKFELWG